MGDNDNESSGISSGDMPREMEAFSRSLLRKSKGSTETELDDLRDERRSRGLDDADTAELSSSEG
jgi:hypothetical protein